MRLQNCRTIPEIAATADLKHYNAETNVKVLLSKREVFFYVSYYMGNVNPPNAFKCGRLKHLPSIAPVR